MRLFRSISSDLVEGSWILGERELEVEVECIFVVVAEGGVEGEDLDGVALELVEYIDFVAVELEVVLVVEHVFVERVRGDYYYYYYLVEDIHFVDVGPLVQCVEVLEL